MPSESERMQRRISNLKLARVLQPSETSILNLKSSLRFLRDNCPSLDEFADFLYKPEFLPLINLAVVLHKDEKRKATSDPYMKHILLTTYYVYKQIEKEKLTDSQKRAIIGASLVHDYIEIRQKKDIKYKDNELHEKLSSIGIDQLEANEIFLMVRFDTPPPKPDDMSGYKRKNAKREDFEKIMNITANDVFENYQATFSFISASEISLEDAEMMSRYIKEIKIADMAAILKETYEDMLTGKDGNNDVSLNELRPLSERIEVFKDRLEILKLRFKRHRLLSQMKLDLGYLLLMLTYSNKKQTS